MKKPDNTLYYGDNLYVLRNKIKDETVDLCYIDPPFNSKRNYNQIYNRIGNEDRAQAQAFIDTWTWDKYADKGYEEIITNDKGRFQPQLIELIKGLHAVLGEDSILAYLVHMSLRITEIHRVLKSTGSSYLHCDPTSSHYLRIVLDAIFVPQGGDFRNEIVWKRTSGHSNAIKFGSVHDTILYYSKSAKLTWNDNYQPYDQAYVDQYYRYKDTDGRHFMSGDASAPAGGGYTYKWKGITRAWRCPPETMERLDKEGRIFYTKNGIPRIKRYLHEAKGMPTQDIWGDIEALRSWNNERLGYPTQKPEALLERIIKASSNEGDVVLDAYCGCGTTVAVAQRLNRKWIGIDITFQSIKVILDRIKDRFGNDIRDSIITDGIPRDMESVLNLIHKKDDRTRKEFEKWAALTYDDEARVNEKKGADGGIDARSYFATGKDTSDKIVYQVKSGKVERNDIATLHSDMKREKAEMAVFITLKPSTKPMIDAAKEAGKYDHKMLGRKFDRISIVTVKDILDGKKSEIPHKLNALKSAEKVKGPRPKGLFDNLPR